MSRIQSVYRNRLLLKLSDSELDLLGPLEPVELMLRTTLETANTPIDFIYFMEEGIASVVAEVPGDGAIEVGVIGREGMTGLAVVAGDTQAPFDTFMQVAGSGWRIEADRLRAAITGSASMHALLVSYARTFTVQIASTAFANGCSKLEERLARWLLMVGDRAGDSYHITHEFLATMLAVRRSGVTLALQILEGKGLIRSSRGQVSIIDREGLIEAASGSYGLAEREYERVLG